MIASKRGSRKSSKKQRRRRPRSRRSSRPRSRRFRSSSPSTGPQPDPEPQTVTVRLDPEKGTLVLAGRSGIEPERAKEILDDLNVEFSHFPKVTRLKIRYNSEENRHASGSGRNRSIVPALPVEVFCPCNRACVLAGQPRRRERERQHTLPSGLGSSQAAVGHLTAT